MAETPSRYGINLVDIEPYWAKSLPLKKETLVKGVVIQLNRSSLSINDEEDSISSKDAKTYVSSPTFKDKPTHYLVEDGKFCRSVDTKYLIESVANDTMTDECKELLGEEPNEGLVSINIMLPEKSDYADIEKTLAVCVAQFISETLTIDNIYNAHPLDKTYSAMHFMDEERWTSFKKSVSDIADIISKSKSADEAEKKIAEYDFTPSYTDEEVRELYLKYYLNPEVYEKEINNIKDTGILSFSTVNNNNFTYEVKTTGEKDSSHCSKASDTLTAKVEPSGLKVEPVYPDIILPPGATKSFTASDAHSSSQSNNTSLSVEEFEKRQSVFNIKDYADAKKIIKGKPVNNNDPFPVDEKIKELESHLPKIKIDEVNFKLTDCNHPGSVIGNAVAKNFGMIQDEIVTISKRTERRIARLENNMATIMRNLFRLSSRINVNCVYYGGQSVYGKYKCIRCLHDDRVNDGQIMTIDQCLSCTRYEPILGQVYAILDDNGTNISQVLDDMQMSYMNKSEYMDFTRAEELINEKNFADLSVNSGTPKQFEEMFDEGFKMDWNETVLETQKADIAEYDVEEMEASKPVAEKPNEGEVEEEFKNVPQDNTAYETLKFSSEDYPFVEFGDSSGIGGINGFFGANAAEIRNKIVAYAQNALELCKQGKGRYTINTDSSAGPTRYSHDDNAAGGVHYWDCSSLAEAAYKAAGITTVSGNTTTEYPTCFPSAGGMFFGLDEIDKVLPGDLVWFTVQSPKPTSNFEEAVVGQIGHVAVYVGDGMYIEASTDDNPIDKQIQLSPVENWDGRIYCFGRPYSLVEADKSASALYASGEGFLDIKAEGFSQDIIDKAMMYCEGQVNETIKYMKQYGYGPHVIKASQEIGVNPYIVLGLIATESSGNPTANNGHHAGLMQVPVNEARCSAKLEDIKADINKGCWYITQKQTAIAAYCPKECAENMGYVLYAYNAGEGIPVAAINKYGATANMLAGEAVPYITKGVLDYYRQDKVEEVTTYVAKIIVRAAMFQQLKALE